MVDQDEAKLLRFYKNYQNSLFPILTMYLSREGKDSPSGLDLATVFHSVKHKFLSKDERKQFRVDLTKIEKYLYEYYDGRGKRSVVFFSGDKSLWKVFDFEFSLPVLGRVSYSPYFEPILVSLKNYNKYLVLLADREKARLFTVHLGKIEEKEDFWNVPMVPRKVKAKKTEVGRDNKIFRHIETHLGQHLEAVVARTAEFARGKNIQFLFIGSHRELLGKIRRKMPYPYDRMIKGEFITELNIPLNDIFLKTKEMASQVNLGH